VVLGLLIEASVALTYWPYYPKTEPFDQESSARIYNAPGYSFAVSRSLSGWNDPRLSRQVSESDFEFSSRVSRVVHSSTYHCGLNAYQQSWLAYIGAKLGLFQTDIGLLAPEIFKCGLCHQRSFLVAKALRLGGVPSGRILGLNGHVVAAFDDAGITYTLDPDFGVGPLQYDGKHDDEIAGAYKGLLPDFPATNASIIQAYSTRDDNVKISVEMLENIEQAQAKSVHLLEIARVLIIIFGLACIGLGIALRPRRDLKPAQA
jgi:hypothetical protein